MLLKFNNLTIRNATANDAEQLATWWNDGKIMAQDKQHKKLQIALNRIRTTTTDD